MDAHATEPDTSTNDDGDLPKDKSSTVKPTTRHRAVIFGLGSATNEEDRVLTGSRLPTNEQVL